MEKLKLFLWTIAIVILGVVIGTFFIGKGEKEKKIIRVMNVNDLSGAPILVMEKMDLIKKHNPNYEIRVTVQTSGAQVNEAFITNQVDIGVMGIPNIIIGIDKGIPYKIMNSVSNTIGGIQTNNLNIKSLADIKPNDKIAIPNLTGTSALQLYILSERELGDYNALKNNLIVMSDDNAVPALINKSGITLHMTQFMYRMRENQEGLPTVISSASISDEPTMDKYSVASLDFFEKHQDLYEAFSLALKEAIDLINDKNDDAFDIMANEYGFAKETLIEYLDLGYIRYESDNYNIDPYIDIAYKMELISEKKEITDMIFIER